MNFSEYLNLVTSGKDQAQSAISKAKQMAAALRNSHNESANVIGLLSSYKALIAEYRTTSSTHEMDANVRPDETWLVKYKVIENGNIAKEVYDDLKRANCDPQEYAFYGTCTQMGSTDGDSCIDLYVNNYSLYIGKYLVLKVNFQELTPKSVEILTDFKGIFDLTNEEFNVSSYISKVLNGFGVTESYATVLEYAADTYTTTQEKVDTASNAIQSLVDNLKCLSSGDKTSIMQCFSGGIKNLVDFFSSKFSAIQNDISNPQAQGFPSSSEIVVSEFAPGIAVSLLSTGLSVVGFVSAAVGGLIGGLIAVVSFIGSTLVKMLASALTDYEDTRFSIAFSKQGVDNTFSFCMDQAVLRAANITTWMRRQGYTFATIYEKNYRPLIHYVYLLHPEDNSSIELGVETHLSMDFDIFFGHAGLTRLDLPWLSSNVWQNFSAGLKYCTPEDDVLKSVYFISDPASGHSVLLGRPQYSAESYSDDSAFLPFICYGGADDGDNHMLTPEEFYNLSYHPINLNFLSSIKSLLGDDELEGTLWRRLCSAMLLLLYDIFEVNKTVTISDSWRHQPFWYRFNSNPNLNHYVRFGTSGNHCDIRTWDLSRFLDGLTYPVRSTIESVPGVFSDYLTIGDLTALDNVLIGIKELFNQVALPKVWRTNGNAHSYGTNGNIDVIYWNTQNGSAPSRNNFSTLEVEGYIPGTITGFSPVVVTPEGDSMLDYMYVANSWPTGMLITMPTLTFSGYIAGLIVDGLVVAALTAVTIAGVVGYIKLRNYQAQLQARTDYAVYKYGEQYDNSGTAEAKAANTARWKEYKFTRLKSNILGGLLGINNAIPDPTESGMDKVNDVINTIMGQDGGEEMEDSTLPNIIIWLRHILHKIDHHDDFDPND